MSLQPYRIYYIRVNGKGATLFVRNEEGHTMDLIEFISDLDDINEILLAFRDWIGKERVYYEGAKPDEVWYTFVREGNLFPVNSF